MKDALVCRDIGATNVSERRPAAFRPEIPQFRIQVFQTLNVLRTIFRNVLEAPLHVLDLLQSPLNKSSGVISR